MSATKRKGIYVVLEGAPGPESGHFVEIEDSLGRGLGDRETGATGWHQRTDGLWELGPFAPGFGEPLTRRERAALFFVARERGVDRSGAAWEETGLAQVTEEEWRKIALKLGVEVPEATDLLAEHAASTGQESES